jgi:hypothetical protein
MEYQNVRSVVKEILCEFAEKVASAVHPSAYVASAAVQ